MKAGDTAQISRSDARRTRAQYKRRALLAWEGLRLFKSEGVGQSIDVRHAQIRLAAQQRCAMRTSLTTAIDLRRAKSGARSAPMRSPGLQVASTALGNASGTGRRWQRSTEINAGGRNANGNQFPRPLAKAPSRTAVRAAARMALR